MARKSVIAREIKRERLVAKYADLRKKLKEAGDYEALDKLPKNSSKVRLHNRCKLTGKWQMKVLFRVSQKQAGNNL